MWIFLGNQTEFFTPTCNIITRERLLQEFPALRAAKKAVLKVQDDVLESVMMLSTLVREHKINPELTPDEQLNELNK
jgi:hypothetical protein